MGINKILPSRLNLINDCLSHVLREIEHLNFSKDDIFKIKLSMEEALVNAIKHGNQSNPELPVEVSLNIKQDGVEIVVTDQGSGFDFRNIDDPTNEDNLRKLSGRGVFLIKEQMDKVEFFDNGRGIKMTKLFSKEANGGNKD